MADVRKVADDFAVAPQIAHEDFAEIAAAGFKFIVNNRPDGEAHDQITSVDAQRAAEAVGLTYAYIPVVGAPNLSNVHALAEALSKIEGPTLAYCRSGTRSITLWALTQAKMGALAPGQAVSAAETAGYDLHHLEPVLAELASA